MVGPTVLMVSMGTGAPARIDSSKKMYCSMAERPGPRTRWAIRCPASRPAAICLTTRRMSGPIPWLVGQLGLHLGGEQVGVVVAQRGSGAPRVPRCSRSPWGPSRSCAAGTGAMPGCRPTGLYSGRSARRAGGPTAGPDGRPRRCSTTGRAGRLEHVTFDPSGRHRRRPAGRPPGRSLSPAGARTIGEAGAGSVTAAVIRMPPCHAIPSDSAALPPSPEEHHMPEAVIVATGRTPIGRANKGSLVDCRPDDLAALVIREVLAKVPAARPAVGRGRDHRIGPARRRGRLQRRPGGRPAGRAARRARGDRQPLLLLLPPDHPHGGPRHPGRRGRRLRRRRRGDGQPLPATARPTPARTTRRSPTPRPGPRPGRRPAGDPWTPLAGTSPTSTSPWARRPRTWPSSRR